MDLSFLSTKIHIALDIELCVTKSIFLFLITRNKQRQTNLLTDDISANLEMLPLSLDEAIECAENSQFIKNSDFADIAAHYIEKIKSTN